MLRAFGDENTQVALLFGLRRRGIDVSWVAERGLQGLPDPDVAGICLTEQRVLLTTDTDHLVLSAEANRRGEQYPPVIFWAQRGRTTGEILPLVFQILDGDDFGPLIGRVLFV